MMEYSDLADTGYSLFRDFLGFLSAVKGSRFVGLDGTTLTAGKGNQSLPYYSVVYGKLSLRQNARPLERKEREEKPLVYLAMWAMLATYTSSKRAGLVE